ncbi:glutathione S-transferase [Favolaschia claudopus]|uniref:glutathione transferase n=1 Tax=Favolaschia claudopus TaxID=2862362 RepID=A0AAW0E404_9AGAR
MSSLDRSDLPTITLHWLEKSRAQRILWLLEELNLPYEIKRYKREPGTNYAPPELKSVHAIGKSPVLTIGDLTLAESALIVEYLTEHFGPGLIPSKWKPGLEGKVAGETDEYMRYRYLMHYSEGSFMPLLLTSIVASNIKSAPVPFFIRPITSRISGQINNYVIPNLTTHLTFLEEQLASSPNGGSYLCGDKLTGADIIMSFPILGVLNDKSLAVNRATYPKLFAYADELQKGESYKRAVEKIIALEGEYVLVP